MSGDRPQPVVAIDGPAGVGKSTTAREVADRLGFTLVDTGALYRTVALIARERGADWEDGEAVAEVAAGLPIALGRDESGGTRVRVGERDCSKEIRRPEISMGASTVSKHPEVRSALLGLQRQLGAEGGVVLEGRDIGTVVFPDAEVKVFLTARAEVRARRRWEEERAKGGATTFEETLAEVRRRDRQDETRAVAPLRQAPDAVVIDSSEQTVGQVVERVVELVART